MNSKLNFPTLLSHNPTAWAGGLLALALMLAGCAPKYVFKVDALRGAPDGSLASSGTFHLEPGGDHRAGDLHYQEAARYARKALIDRGFTEASNPSAADIRVAVDFGIGAGETAFRTVTQPIYLRESPRYDRVVVQYRDKDGKIRRSFSTVYVPSRVAFVDHREQTVAYREFPKFLSLTAHAAGTGPLAEQKQVWSVRAGIRDSSEDLRAYLPWLALALQPYIGEDTGKQVEVIIEPGSGKLSTES